MVLRVLGSSSSGNAYILENVGEALLIEAGVNFKKVVAALEGNISKVVGLSYNPRTRRPRRTD